MLKIFQDGAYSVSKRHATYTHKDGSMQNKLLCESHKSVMQQLKRGVEWVHGLFLFPLVLGKTFVVATCKIGSFLCSSDNLLQKNIIVLFFRNQISKWRSFVKRTIFDLLFTFSSHQGKVTKIPYTYFTHPIDFFCLHVFQFWKKYEFIRYGFSLSLVWVLVLILIRAILKQSINNKMVSKI